MQNLTLSITQLNNYIKNIFDNEELLIGVSVYGEVTNFKISNGIAYFDIKEDGAQLSCVKFSSFSAFAKNGDKVFVTGKLNYHVKLGKLSFVVSKVEPYGMGELYKSFLELKASLEAEGIFDPSKKKSIPKYVNTIGVVTSETGAVIRDIYRVTKSKNPYTNIVVYPSKVQGVNAEKEIAEGIKYFNDKLKVDVIIIARGGGSFEDLAPFNTEIIARAIYDSDIPIISAVGHETDFSISDFASDLRAPTPSVAAELAVFDYYGELQYIENIKNNLVDMLSEIIINKKDFVIDSTDRILKNIESKMYMEKSRLMQCQDSIYNKTIRTIDYKKYKLDNLVSKLEKSNPLTILKSGYAKVYSGGKSVDIDTLQIGDTLETYISDGLIVSKVEKIEVKK